MSAVLDFFTARLPLEGALDQLEKKRVPVHKYGFFYYLGGICLYLIIVQIITGILLLFYYEPTEAQAYESVRFIMTKVSFGWLVRSIHAWSANILIGALFVHLFSTFLLKAYRPPREFTWITGMALFGVCLGLGFTGYLLPWNELAFFATKVGTEMTAVMPVVGETLKEFLRGGPNVTGVTLTRFFAFHIWILPAAALAIIGIHLLMVQYLGMSRPVPEMNKPKRSMSFMPQFLLRDLTVWLVLLAVLVGLSWYFPAHLGQPADPLAPTPVGIKPEWYFLFMFQALKKLPAHILGIEGELFGMLVFGLAGAFILLAPFFDKKSARGESSPLFTTIGWAAVAFVLAMTIWGWVA